jgi:hypothetical protein
MIKDIIVRFTEYWLIWLGVIVVALVMGFPGGVMSIFTERRIAWRPARSPTTHPDIPAAPPHRHDRISED